MICGDYDSLNDLSGLLTLKCHTIHFYYKINKPSAITGNRKCVLHMDNDKL